MGLALAYHLLSEPALTHSHNCCYEREFGRVRSVAFIRKAYLQTILSNPTGLSVWQAGIAAGEVVVVPQTAGSFDPGEPLRLKGFGRRLYTFGPRDMTLNFSDPYYRGNFNFYNSIHRQTSLVVAFRTSGLLHIADVAASIFAKDPVEDDLESEVRWDVTCQMRSRSLPVKVKVDSLLTLFNCTPNPIIKRILSVPGGKFILTNPEGNYLNYKP